MTISTLNQKIRVAININHYFELKKSRNENQVGAVVTHSTRIWKVTSSNPGSNQPDWDIIMASCSHQGKYWVVFSLLRSIWPLLIKFINHKIKSVNITKKHNYTTIKIHSLLVIHPKILRLDMTKDLSISKLAEKFSYWSTKKANMFIVKRLIEHVCALSTCLTLTNTHILKHTGTCVKSVNMFAWGIFGAVWKVRAGGQELSAEVIRAPGWGSWYPLFDQSFHYKHISLFCAPIGEFFG